MLSALIYGKNARSISIIVYPCTTRNLGGSVVHARVSIAATVIVIIILTVVTIIATAIVIPYHHDYHYHPHA